MRKITEKFVIEKIKKQLAPKREYSPKDFKKYNMVSIFKKTTKSYFINSPSSRRRRLRLYKEK